MPNSASQAVRQLKGGRWQVSLIEAAQWHSCRSERDARVIAKGLNLAAAVRCGEQAGEECADELDVAAGVAVRNLGECWAVQLIRISASRARTQGRTASRPAITASGPRENVL